MKISAVICTKNEERTIGQVIREAGKYVDEALVIDGHSKDRTREIAKELGARVFLDSGKGKGEAMRIGIREAGREIIVFIDADGSHETKDIPKLVKPIIEGKADLVVASREKGGSDELHGDFEKLLRLIGSTIITLVINLRFKVELTDSQNGFRAIKKSVAQKLDLKEDIFTVEQEMIIKAFKMGHRIEEIPSHEYARKHGKSRINLLTMGWRYVWCLIKNIL